MCGITGVYYFDNTRLVDKNTLVRMTNIIRHRGPDGEGYYFNNNIGLGHRRLKIIDLVTGDQPMFNEDKSCAVVFNGEIYNYLQLKMELIKLGHRFRTTSDTEVIINAYLQWGTQCQNKFNGMWAFALWDSKLNQLFLSRDRIGEKPLNYAVYDNAIVFSSEIKSLFEYGIPREIRPELIELYLTLTNIPGPDSFYKNIFKLKPGHFIIVNSNGFTETKYWDLPEIDENKMFKNTSVIYNEFEELFEDAIRIRMISDVPYGAFLSGGLDSSSIVSIMSKISKKPINTFTIGFPFKEFDESSLAKLVADKFRTNHYVETVTPDSFEYYLNKSVFHFDEPFGDSSAIPTFKISEFAVDKVKMVLTGDGGDEVLSGYNSYVGIKLSNIIRQFPVILQKSAIKSTDILAKYFIGESRYKINRLNSIIATASLPFYKQMAYKASYISVSTLKNITEQFNNSIKIEDYFSDITNRIPYKDDFYKLMYLNFKYNLPDDYLVKVDRMSMANSLETRAPFLDHRLIEFMTLVDKRIKLHGWERKNVLKKTIGKRLPTELLTASKRGFGIPLREWFKSDLLFNANMFKNITSIISLKNIQQLIEENRKMVKDNGNFLWALLILDRNM